MFARSTVTEVVLSMHTAGSEDMTEYGVEVLSMHRARVESRTEHSTANVENLSMHSRTGIRYMTTECTIRVEN